MKLNVMLCYVSPHFRIGRLRTAELGWYTIQEIVLTTSADITFPKALKLKLIFVASCGGHNLNF